MAETGSSPPADNVFYLPGATGPASPASYIESGTEAKRGYKANTAGPSGPTGPYSPKGNVNMATERELTDAKLEAVEARVEARLAGIEGKIDRLLDRVEDSVTASKEAKTEASLAKTAAGNTKWNILFTGLTVLALVIAVWAIWNQGMELVAGLLSVNSTAGQ